MLRDDEILIKHILEAAEKSVDFLSKHTIEEFKVDEKLSLNMSCLDAAAFRPADERQRIVQSKGLHPKYMARHP